MADLQKHLDISKHSVKLTKESTYDTIKRKCMEAVHSVEVGYVHGQTSPKDPDEQSQVDLKWFLQKMRKVVAFYQKAKNYLVDVFWTGEETVKKATALDVASQMKSLRDDTGQKMFSKTEWLTEQQIGRYFS